MYKIDKISDPILFDKRPIRWKYCILGKEIQTWMRMKLMRILKGLINFIRNWLQGKSVF
jgi:hypothetical protein